MIPRDTAAALIRGLERALDSLLKVHVAAEGLSTTDAAAQQIEALWLATANTAGMLAVIEEGHPDLTGPDVAFREPGSQAATVRTEPDRQLMRAKLQEAVGLLEEATETLDAAQGISATEHEHFRLRLAQSLEALRSALAQL